MRRRRSYAFSMFHDSLEARLSLSAFSLGRPAPSAAVLTMPNCIGGEPIPPPDPEPDPGPFPGEDPPIVYPPLPPSGPVGPGYHRQGP